MYIKFKYKDRYTNGEWNEQECNVRSIKECKELYGLGIDCEYQILEISELYKQLYYELDSWAYDNLDKEQFTKYVRELD